MELIKFNVELAKTGAQVVTRDGHEVEIIKWDAKGEFPIVALVSVDGNQYAASYDLEGKETNQDEFHSDLFIRLKEDSINLTGAKCQGGNMKNLIVENGTYILPFKLYEAENGQFQRNIKVNVVNHFIDRGTLFIVVPDGEHDYYYVFYYNQGEMKFKPNWDVSDEYTNILNWIDLDIED